MTTNKRDLSISMVRANVVVFFIAAPLMILPSILFFAIHTGRQVEDHPTHAGCYVLEPGTEREEQR